DPTLDRPGPGGYPGRVIPRGTSTSLPEVFNTRSIAKRCVSKDEAMGNVSSRGRRTKQFVNATKPFWRFRANVLKRLTVTDHPNDALGDTGALGAKKQGTIMFNSAKLSSRLVAAAVGSLTVGAIALSTSAAAAPLPL